METKGLTILSLFDGMSCGRIALERAGLAVDKYVASEVDKYAVAVSRANWPDIIQMGSVTDLSFRNGVLSSGIDEVRMGKVDLFIGGSPCQSFSFAGSRKGMVTKDNVEILTLDHYLQLKEDGFEFQGQSYLFWEYVRILREVQRENPDVIFLLENVKMAKKWQDLISGVLGVEPIVINSALVSAQNRVRLYWTNLQGITQPEDRGILLKDIIDYSAPFVNSFDESKTKFDPSITNGVITINPKKVDGTQSYQQDRIYDTSGKMVCLSAELSGRFNISKPIKIGNINPSGRGQGGNLYSVEGKSPTLMAGHDYVHVAKPINLGNVNPSGKGQNGNVYSDQGVSPCLTTNKGEGVEIATFIDREKSYCIDANYWKGGNPTQYFEKSRRQLVFGGAFRGRYNEDGKVVQNMELRSDGKQNCLTTVTKDSLVFTEVRPASIVGRRINDKGVRDDYNKSVPITQCLQVKHDPSKAPCLTTVEKDCLLSLEGPGRYPDAYNRPELLWRKLTPMECERLQTVPDNYSSAVSNSQRYKMLGNGWTVDVITHILKGLK